MITRILRTIIIGALGLFCLAAILQVAQAGAPSGPTMAQIQAQHPPAQSLWSYLAALPSSGEAQIFYALAVGSIVGMLGHYLKRWSTGEIAGNLVDYLFKQYPRRTALSVFGALTWCAGEVGSGIFLTDAGEFVGWGLIILSGLKTGYLGDSIANRAAPAAERLPAAPEPVIAPAPAAPQSPAKDRP